MDSRLLGYYERELRHLRESANEFAAEFPKIASRLGLPSTDPIPDPYVERLLEGFAYLTSRVQLKLDAEFPRFTQHLLESVYPHYLSPMPSMCIAQVTPDLNDAGLGTGMTIERGTALKSILGRGDKTACEYRTGHDLTLWPLRITQAQYYTREVTTLDLPDRFAGRATPRAGLRLRLAATAGLTLAEIELDTLDLCLTGTDQTPNRIYEQLFAHPVAVVARPPGRPAPWQEVLGPESIHQLGFEPSEALLPQAPRSFEGYRLLREYFAFPERFRFARLTQLRRALARCDQTEIELVVLFDAEDEDLEGAVTADNFQLHCVPAINLFPKRTDRIHVEEKQWEFHVVPDRTKPLDFEIFEITGVEGYGAGTERLQEFLPFYAASDFDDGTGGAYFASNRRPRVTSSREKRQGRRTSYAGSEVFVSLVDAANAPFRSDLKQLGISTLCTNRHLPLSMPVGSGRTDLVADIGISVDAIRVIAGPTRPRPSFAEGELSWRLISHLTLNYLSLVDTDSRDGAGSLRDLLKLYGDASEPAIRKQVQGLRHMNCQPVTRRVPTPGPIAFARGLELDVTMDEPHFEGTGIFMLGAVLERFFAKYVSINSFTETVVRSADRGEVMRWPARIGQRAIL